MGSTQGPIRMDNWSLLIISKFFEVLWNEPKPPEKKHFVFGAR